MADGMATMLSSRTTVLVRKYDGYLLKYGTHLITLGCVGLTDYGQLRERDYGCETHSIKKRLADDSKTAVFLSCRVKRPARERGESDGL